MTYEEAKTRLAILIDRYTNRGTAIASTDENVADFYNKMYCFLDVAQKHIAEMKPIKKHYRISQYLPFTPTTTHFENTQHTDSDITYSTGTAYAYHFSVDDTADVYIEGVNSDGSTEELDLIMAYSDNGFTSFKDLITIPTDSDYESIQIRFSGDNFYNIKNVALINAKYSYYDKIPDFSRYISYDLPSDFLRPISVEIRQKYDYKPLTDFVWESPDTIAISAYESGEIRIEYASKPTTITSTTGTTYEFEIDDSLQDAMLYYAAALLLQHENVSVSSRYFQLYEEKIINYNSNRRMPQTKVKRVY